MTYTKIKFYIILDLIFFSRINNKKFTKPLLFLYELSIVVLIDFMAILLTPGIFLIQIVNRNMYLNHSYIKNNKMHFPKVEFLKFQNCFRHSFPSQCSEINCIDICKDSTTTEWCPIFKKKIIMNNYYIYSS